MTESQTTTKRCAALTKAGSRCKNNALSDSEYCYIHQSAANTQSANGRPKVEEIPVEEELRLLHKRSKVWVRQIQIHF